MWSSCAPNSSLSELDVAVLDWIEWKPDRAGFTSTGATSELEARNGDTSRLQDSAPTKQLISVLSRSKGVAAHWIQRKTNGLLSMCEAVHNAVLLRTLRKHDSLPSASDQLSGSPRKPPLQDAGVAAQAKLQSLLRILCTPTVYRCLEEMDAMEATESKLPLAMEKLMQIISALSSAKMLPAGMIQSCSPLLNLVHATSSLINSFPARLLRLVLLSEGSSSSTDTGDTLLAFSSCLEAYLSDGLVPSNADWSEWCEVFQRAYDRRSQSLAGPLMNLGVALCRYSFSLSLTLPEPTAFALLSLGADAQVHDDSVHSLVFITQVCTHSQLSTRCEEKLCTIIIGVTEPLLALPVDPSATGYSRLLEIVAGFQDSCALVLVAATLLRSVERMKDNAEYRREWIPLVKGVLRRIEAKSLWEEVAGNLQSPELLMLSLTLAFNLEDKLPLESVATESTKPIPVTFQGKTHSRRRRLAFFWKRVCGMLSSLAESQEFALTAVDWIMRFPPSDSAGWSVEAGKGNSPTAEQLGEEWRFWYLAAVRAFSQCNALDRALGDGLPQARLLQTIVKLWAQSSTASIRQSASILLNHVGRWYRRAFSIAQPSYTTPSNAHQEQLKCWAELTLTFLKATLQGKSTSSSSSSDSQLTNPSTALWLATGNLLLAMPSTSTTPGTLLSVYELLSSTVVEPAAQTWNDGIILTLASLYYHRHEAQLLMLHEWVAAGIQMRPDCWSAENPPPSPHAESLSDDFDASHQQGECLDRDERLLLADWVRVNSHLTTRAIGETAHAVNLRLSTTSIFERMREMIEDSADLLRCQIQSEEGSVRHFLFGLRLANEEGLELREYLREGLPSNRPTPTSFGTRLQNPLDRSSPPPLPPHTVDEGKRMFHTPRFPSGGSAESRAPRDSQRHSRAIRDPSTTAADLHRQESRMLLEKVQTLESIVGRQRHQLDLANRTVRILTAELVAVGVDLRSLNSLRVPPSSNSQLPESLA